MPTHEEVQQQGRPAGASRSRLSLREIKSAFEPLTDRFPPVLSPGQAAELACLKPSTLRRKVSQGDFSDSVARGKPLRFWRDRFVQSLMK